MTVQSSALPEIEPFPLPGLTTRRFGRFACFLPQVDSTNLFLKENAEKLPSGAVCVAGVQTAGRGRLGRSWIQAGTHAQAWNEARKKACDAEQAGTRAGAPPRPGEGRDLPFSLLIRSEKPLPALSLCCGVAVAEALSELTGADFGIKWPNDIICRDKKICGILCESRKAGEGVVFTVCGMGINLTQTAGDFERAGLLHGGSVEMLTGIRLEPSALAAAVLNRLEPLCDSLAADGFEKIKARFAARCITLGRQVSVIEEGRTACGRAVDLSADGSLLVAFPDPGGPGEAVRPVLAGEASVRGLLGYI